MSAPVSSPPRPRRQWLTQLPFLLVLAVVAAGILRISQYHWRQGATLVGAALLLAAVLRAVLSTNRVGMIAVRKRLTDVLLYGGLGAIIVLVAMTIKGGPFG